jgi:DNA gyrase subunit A
LKEIQIIIEKLKDILSSSKKVLSVIKSEVNEIREKYADERKTRIIKGGAKIISVEDLIPDEENALVLTAGGYIKRTNPDEFRKQRRGGVGVIDLETKEEDFITNLLIASTHSDLLFFTDRGKSYQIKMYDIPEGRRATKGKSVMNFLSLEQSERITSILPMPKEAKKSDFAIMMVTKEGVAKKVDASSFHDVRRSGIIAIRLTPGDELVSALFIDKGDTIILATAKGQSIRFKETDVREMGRNAAGVRGIKLGKNDHLIGAHVIKKGVKDATLLVLSRNGYGKRTKIEEYKVQRRGGSGIKTAQVTAKTGDIMTSQIVTEEENEVIAMSRMSQVVRVDLKEIPMLGRQTQGVRVMKLREGDSIASLICF